MSTNRYAKMTSEEFDSILAEILDGQTGEGLLSIPGVYEAVSEHFNNEVLERWETQNPETSKEAATCERCNDTGRITNPHATDYGEECDECDCPVPPVDHSAPSPERLDDNCPVCGGSRKLEIHTACRQEGSV